MPHIIYFQDVAHAIIRMHNCSFISLTGAERSSNWNTCFPAILTKPTRALVFSFKTIIICLYLSSHWLVINMVICHSSDHTNCDSLVGDQYDHLSLFGPQQLWFTIGSMALFQKGTHPEVNSLAGSQTIPRGYETVSGCKIAYFLPPRPNKFSRRPCYHLSIWKLLKVNWHRGKRKNEPLKSIFVLAVSC